MKELCASTCPYCGSVLAKRPMRKTVCKSCGEPIFARNTHGPGVSLLLTAQQAADFDLESEKAYEQRCAAKRFGDMLDEINVPKGTPQQRVDAAKRLYDTATEWPEKRQVAWRLASLASDSAEDPAYWLREAALCHLRGFGEVFENRLQIGAWTCCSACKADDGKRFTKTIALAQMPLPHKHCENVNQFGFRECQCYWEIAPREAPSVDSKTN